MDLNRNPKTEELNNLKRNTTTSLTFGHITLLIFFIAVLGLKYFLKIPIHNEIYFLIPVSFLFTCLVQYTLKKRRIKPKLIRRIYFANYIVGLLFITGIFYYFGGIL